MAIKAIKLILRCLLSAFMGGVAALCVLALVCVAIDLFAWLQGPPPVSEGDIAGPSGDSTFGNSALIFFFIYSPIVAFGGLLLFSAPMYYLFFIYGWPRKLPFIWLTVLGTSLIQLFSLYINASYDLGIVYASIIFGLIFASLVVFARDGSRHDADELEEQGMSKEKQGHMTSLLIPHFRIWLCHGCMLFP